MLLLLRTSFLSIILLRVIIGILSTVLVILNFIIIVILMLMLLLWYYCNFQKGLWLCGSGHTGFAAKAWDVGLRARLNGFIDMWIVRL